MQIDENVLVDVAAEDYLSTRHLLNSNGIAANDISFSTSESTGSAVFDPGEETSKSSDCPALSPINGVSLRLRIFSPFHH